MMSMINILKWFLMLSKRLYKKPSFVVLLVLIPACVFAFSIVANQKRGFVQIVLAKSDNADVISSEIIDDLLHKQSMVYFTLVDTPQDAIEEVKSGSADEAWIFPADTENEIDSFVDKHEDYVVSVVTKEQNVMLRLAREKLSGVLYKYCAKAYYIDYIRSNINEISGLSDQELIAYFENVSVDESLFVFGNPTDISNEVSDTNYLTVPIRGLLAVLAVVCGMAATMYYMQDESSGLFAHIKQKRKGLVAFGCVLTAVINVSVVLILSLCLSSLSGNILKEILVLFIYTFCCASFCLLLKQIFQSIRLYAAIIPLLTVVFVGVCPVFFDFRNFSAVQILLPPTYYVNSVYDNRYIVYMVIYSAICLLLCFVMQSIKTKIKMRKRDKTSFLT